MSIHCDCHGPPWPKMLRIHTGGISSQYHLCRRCGTIREDNTRTDGTISGTRWHQLESLELPSAVAEQARAILAWPDYDQLPLFEDVE